MSDENKKLNFDIPFRPVIDRSKDSEWYKANSKRLEDPEYLKKLSDSISQFYIDNPDFQKEKVNSPKWKSAQKEGMRKYLDNEDYVHPRGMLGKTHTDEWRENQSKLLKGKSKSLEHNERVSAARKGKKPKTESVEKMREKLIGRETGRSRQVQTPAGVFDKLKDAADFYGVATGSIKNFIKGQNVKEWFKPQLEAKGVTFDGLKPLGFSWLGDVGKELGAKQVQTPDGIFENVKAAGDFYNVGAAAIRHRIKSNPTEYFYIKE